VNATNLAAVAAPRTNTRLQALAAAGKVIAMLFAFLVGMRALGDGFNMLGSGALESFFQATANPFVGLMVGVLATTLVQSSSVTTSIIVGMVAAPTDPLPVASATPMIMGSNIGTTTTNTLVSLAHMGRSKEFRRAFAVATCHDFFNFIVVAVLLPLEIATGFLGSTAASLAGNLSGLGGFNFNSPFKAALKVGSAQLSSLSEAAFGTASAQGAAVVVLSGALIIVSLLLLVKTLRSWSGQSAGARIEKALGGHGVTAMMVGFVVTVMVQSS
jgi:sodium-dependent phosphate cotransporter